MLAKRPDDTSQNVFRRDGNLIFVRLSGPQPASTAKKALGEFKQLIAEVQAEGSKPFVLVDLNDLTLEDVTITARLAIKEAFRQPYVALAAVGKTKLLEVSMYLINASGANRRVRYFTSERRARAWLRTQQNPSRTGRMNSLGLASIFIGFLGLSSLVGWASHNDYLTRIIPELRPINPMASLGLLVVALALINVWTKYLKVITVLSGILLLIGILALLPAEANFDFWLFGDQVHTIGAHAEVADSSALCFIALGAIILAQNIKRRSMIAIQLILAGATMMLALFNAFGLLYAQDYMYNLSPSFVMAFPLAIAFTAGSFVLGATALRRWRGQMVLGQMGRLSWLLLFALLFIQFTTYNAWRETNAQTEETAREAFKARLADITATTTARLNAYTDALHGFRGFYLASDYVNQREFEDYYNATNIAQNYPGMRAVSYIAKVPTRDIPAFTNQHRTDMSLRAQGNPEFTIKNLSKSDPHYIVTYIANAPSSPSMGNDLTDSPSRVETFQKAGQTNDLVGSGTVTFDQSATASAGKGFFVTVPVSHGNATSIVGFVNVGFNYDDLFKNLLTDRALTRNIKLAITDAAETAPLYQVNNLKDSVAFAQTSQVNVADRIWNITIQGAKTFEVGNQQLLPMSIIVGGQAFSLLLLIIFFMQNNARKRALELADTITADLQHERDEAIATKIKDETIFGGMAEGLVIFNKQANIMRMNTAAATMLGYDETEAHGRSFDEIMVAFDEKSNRITPNNRPISRSIRHNKVVQARLRYQRKNGTYFDAQVTTSPLLINGKAQGGIEVFRDITKDLQLEQAKSEFVSLASHQLRTPLSAINWYAEMLLNGDMGTLSKDQQMQVQEIYDGNQRMIELVDSLLNVSRLEVGKLRNEPKETSLLEITESLEHELATSIKGKQMQFKKTIDKDLPTVYADPKLLRMVLQNLLSNAVKYTPDKGSVSLIMRRATHADISNARTPQDQQYIFIQVSDTGYGIPKDQQNKIFEKLYRADNVRRLDVEGTGLGLYIVKEVVEMLGGHVWFTSIESAGTSFYAVIPLKTTPSK